MICVSTYLLSKTLYSHLMVSSRQLIPSKNMLFFLFFHDHFPEKVVAKNLLFGFRVSEVKKGG